MDIQARGETAVVPSTRGRLVMVTIPARIVECECGKLITLDALTIGGVTCPACNKKHNPTQS
jgi:hypothetical protein